MNSKFGSPMSIQSEAITTMEGDAGKISEVMKVFKNFENIFEECNSPSPVLKAEEKIVKEILQKRKVFCVRNIHYAANLLDPNYKGCTSLMKKL